MLVVAWTTALSSQRSPQAPTPVVVHSEHNDLSPPLRDVPPAAAAANHRPEAREPRPLRRARGLRGLAPDPVVQDAPAAPLVPLPSWTFDGVNNVNGVLPPDANGDVGPNHYVQWANLSFAIFSKGTPTTPPALLYGPSPGNTLWSGFGGPCETRNDGDPVVRYDHLADRWVMSQLAVPNSFFGLLFAPFYQCIAVSATPDPTGPYYRYQFSFNKLNDYPKLAVWPDAYYMTINQFRAITLQYEGQGVIAFDRTKMLDGLPAAITYFDLASVDMNLGGMLPADLDGPPPPSGSPGYFAQIDDDAWGYSPDQMQLWRFHVDWIDPSQSSFTGPTVLPTAPFDSDMCGHSQTCIPQPGTTAKLDALSDRLMYRLQYRNFGDHESLVVNHTVDADGTDHAGIRWYEIRNPGAAPFIYQQGTYAPDANHRWMGSIAMDRVGNMALGFSISSPATWPSIRYAGRLATDPPGSMTQGETDLVVGSGSQTDGSGRWGDYSMMAVDPTDDCTFWYTQEYYVATSPAGWRTRIGSFSFPSCAPAAGLPRVTIAVTTATATEAGPTSGVLTVTRTGDTTSALTVSYAAAGTATAGADYIALPGTVTIPAGASTATISVTPIDDSLVEPNETVIVSLAADPAYGVGSPGSATITIVSDDTPPDLVIASVSAPALAGADMDVTISDTTTNQGAGASGPSVTGFYLSTNLVFDAGDLFLGSRPVPQLPPGGAHSATTTVRIPARTMTGTYFVFAVADDTHLVAETQEGNNTKATSSALRIGPDLLVTSLSGPSTSAAGATISVSDTTMNQGGGNAPDSTTSFYLSSNVTLDAGDVILGGRAVPALAAGAANSASTVVTIPAGTPGGTYYVLAKADSANSVVETQETNNVKIGTTIKIGPDLIVSSVTGPSTAGAGGTILVSDTTKNQGAAAASASSTAFYLSINATLDAPDVFLNSRPVPSLAAGAMDSTSTSLQIPAGTATGTYYVIATADSTGVVAESVETNNASAVVLRIGPDLTVSALSSPTSAVAGAPITVSDTTKNAGGGSANASTTRFYLSTNLTVDAADIVLGSRPVGALVAGASDTASSVLPIPASTAAGTYWLIALADATNTVTETTESNNTRVVSIRINAAP